MSTKHGLITWKIHIERVKGKGNLPGLCRIKNKVRVNVLGSVLDWYMGIPAISRWPFWYLIIIFVSKNNSLQDFFKDVVHNILKKCFVLTFCLT